MMSKTYENVNDAIFTESEMAAELSRWQRKHGRLIKRLEKWLKGTKGHSVYNKFEIQQLQQIIDEARGA
jgi:hypothetical protein